MQLCYKTTIQHPLKLYFDTPSHRKTTAMDSNGRISGKPTTQREESDTAKMDDNAQILHKTAAKC